MGLYAHHLNASTLTSDPIQYYIESEKLNQYVNSLWLHHKAIMIIVPFVDTASTLTEYSQNNAFLVLNINSGIVDGFETQTIRRNRPC